MQELIQIAERNNRLLAVGYVYKYDQNIWRLRRVIQKNKLGKVSEVELNMLNLPEAGNPDKRVNVIEDLVPHTLSILDALLLERTSVNVKVDIDKSGDKAKISFIYCRGYGRDISVVINVDRNYSGKESNKSVIVRGDKLTAILDYQNGKFEVRDAAGDSVSESDKIHPEELSTDGQDKPALELELEDFLKTINGERDRININTAEDVLWISESSERIMMHSRKITEPRDQRSELSRLLKQEGYQGRSIQRGRTLPHTYDDPGLTYLTSERYDKRVRVLSMIKRYPEMSADKIARCTDISVHEVTEILEKDSGFSLSGRLNSANNGRSSKLMDSRLIEQAI